MIFSLQKTMDFTTSLRTHLKTVLLDEEQIAQRLDAMALQLTRDYRGKALCVVALMNGSYVFLADLLRRLDFPLEVESLRITSYDGTTSTGKVVMHQDRWPDLRGRHILLLDDILDTGCTLAAVRSRFEAEGTVESIRSCVLLQKRTERNRGVTVDMAAFDIPDLFVVGYGLDYRGMYRNLPVIGVLRDELI